MVTITSVGYGDLAPTTGAGQAIAGAIMILGIGALGVALGKMGELFFAIGRKPAKMPGFGLGMRIV